MQSIGDAIAQAQMDTLETLIRNKYFTEKERQAIRAKASAMTNEERSAYLIRGSEYLKERVKQETL